MSKKKSQSKAPSDAQAVSPEPPKLARRSMNRKSTIKSGRTIGEKREKLETANERAEARKKDKRKTRRRIVSVSIVFLIVPIIIAYIAFIIITGNQEEPLTLDEPVPVSYEPTIEIVDEDASTTEGKLTNRMRLFIGQVEADLKELGYTPIKAVIPTSTIREVDFYIEGYDGYIKTTIDRGAGVTAEDTDRMLRYLEEQGNADFNYVDVRVDGKAYWR